MVVLVFQAETPLITGGVKITKFTKEEVLVSTRPFTSFTVIFSIIPSAVCIAHTFCNLLECVSPLILEFLSLVDMSHARMKFLQHIWLKNSIAFWPACLLVCIGLVSDFFWFICAQAKGQGFFIHKELFIGDEAQLMLCDLLGDKVTAQFYASSCQPLLGFVLPLWLCTYTKKICRCFLFVLFTTE